MTEVKRCDSTIDSLTYPTTEEMSYTLKNVSASDAELEVLCCGVLRHMDKSGCPESIDPLELRRGSTSEFMNAIRFIFCKFSKYVHQSVSDHGFTFSTTNVLSFMRTINDVIHSEFGVFGEVNMLV